MREIVASTPNLLPTVVALRCDTSIRIERTGGLAKQAAEERGKVMRPVMNC